MRAQRVEVPPPAFDDDLRLRECEGVEEFVAQPGVERLDEAVSPGTSGRDIGGLRANLADPTLHGLGDELKALSERTWSGMPRRMNKSERMDQLPRKLLVTSELN